MGRKDHGGHKRKGNRDGEGHDQKRTCQADFVQDAQHCTMFHKYYQAQNLFAPEEWESFMKSLITPLPSTFRITGTRETAGYFLRLLEEQYFNKLASVNADVQSSLPSELTWYPGRTAWKVDVSRELIRSKPEFQRLHKFLVAENAQGNISRQEAVSMIPPLLLDVQPHHKVLDMCAAPGSKTAQLIELLHAGGNPFPSGCVIANDADNKRCYLLVHQTKRLQSPCLLVTNHDASLFPSLSLKSGSNCDALMFDRILCDVPCSGDGTMRKNPILWRRWGVGAAFGLHPLQLRILIRGLELLQVNGLLIYSTCTFNPVENEAVLAAAFRKHPGCFEIVDVSSQLPGLKRRNGLTNWKIMDKTGTFLSSVDEVSENQKSSIKASLFAPNEEEVKTMHLERAMRLLPHDMDTGGFFVALIRKIAPITKNDRKKRQTDQKATTTTTKETEPSSVVTEQAEEQVKEQETEQNNEAEEEEVVGSVVADVDDVVDDEDVIDVANEEDQETDQVADVDGPIIKSEPKKGLKEDPFFYFNENDNDWNSIKKFYAINDEFPSHLLATRSQGGKKRNIYITSPIIKSIFESNHADTIRLINSGLRLFMRNECEGCPCDFRLTQEALDVVAQHMTARVYDVPLTEVRKVVQNESVGFDDLDSTLSKQLLAITEGCAVLNFTPPADNQNACALKFVIWRGRKTARCFIPKEERHHFLLLLGFTPDHIEELEKRKPHHSKGKTASNQHGYTPRPVASSSSTETSATA